MQTIPSQENQDRRSLATIASELSLSLKNMLQSEVHLAKAELKDAAGRAGSHLGQTAAFGALAALGILPLMSFLVIGLGRLLNDNYWLSSLIVAVVFIGVGGALALASIKKMKQQDLSLPNTRASFERELRTVETKVHEISEASKNAAQRKVL